MPAQALAPRRTALIIWGALLFGLTAFLVVAFFARRSFGAAEPELERLLLTLVAVLAVAQVLASRIVPRLMRAPPGATADQHALTRTIVASALCEGPGLFAIVTFLLTGSPLALVLLLLPLGGLVACYPSDARWETLGGRPLELPRA